MICVVIGYSLGRKSHSWQNLSLFGRCYLTSHVKTRSSFLKASFGFIFKMCTQIWFCINNVNYSLNLQIICAILWYVLLSGREISVISHSPIVFQSRGLSVSPWSGFLTVFVTQTMCTHCSHKCHLKNEIITCSTIRQASPRYRSLNHMTGCQRAAEACCLRCDQTGNTRRRLGDIYVQHCAPK